MSFHQKLVMLALLVGAGAAQAQPYQSKGEAGGWSIFVNEANMSCFMERRTEEGLIMQMGTGGDVEMGYLALYTRDFTDLLHGETQEITLKLGEQVFSAKAEGYATEGYSGGYFLGNNPLLGYDLATQEVLVVNPGGEKAFSVALAGVEAAMAAVRACQAEIKG